MQWNDAMLLVPPGNVGIAFLNEELDEFKMAFLDSIMEWRATVLVESFSIAVWESSKKHGNFFPTSENC